MAKARPTTSKAKVKPKTKSAAKAKIAPAKKSRSDASSAMPGTGKVAPAFALTSDAGKQLRLADFKGKKHVVLYFYPKADTPGCTKEACAFAASEKEFAKHGAIVIGISPDAHPRLAKFRDKYKLNFPLVADDGATIAKKYGVWQEKSLYGRRFMGIQRATFLIGKDGKVAFVWPKVKVDGHSDAVLEELKQL